MKVVLKSHSSTAQQLFFEDGKRLKHCEDNSSTSLSSTKLPCIAISISHGRKSSGRHSRTIKARRYSFRRPKDLITSTTSSTSKPATLITNRSTSPPTTTHTFLLTRLRKQRRN